MTEKESTKQLLYHAGEIYKKAHGIASNVTASEALEKQIAKKCEIYTAIQPGIECDYEVDVYECPTCGVHIGAVDESNQLPHCWNCGQKLDW